MENWNSQPDELKALKLEQLVIRLKNLEKCGTESVGKIITETRELTSPTDKAESCH